jgi:hypothetical protein
MVTKYGSKLADRQTSMVGHATVGVFGDETKTDTFRSVHPRHSNRTDSEMVILRL